MTTPLERAFAQLAEAKAIVDRLSLRAATWVESSPPQEKEAHSNLVSALSAARSGVKRAMAAAAVLHRTP